MRRATWLVWSLFFSSTFLLPVFGDTLPVKTLRHDDPRLEQPVSAVASRVDVGELLEALSQQSGVPLSASDATGAGDVEVTVSLHKVPLADAMDALRSLVSYRNAEWEWRRKGAGATAHYELARSLGARSLPDTLREQMQAEFEAQSQTMRADLNMTPDQLQKAAATDPLAKSILDDGRVRPSMTIFANLPPDTQSRLLRDHEGLTLQAADLPPESHAALQALTSFQSGVAQKAYREHPEWGDSRGVLPDAKKVTIGVQNYSHEIAPSLTVDIGFGSGDIVGGGFMEKAWRKKLADLWMLPGDAAADPAAARQVPTAPDRRDPDPKNPFHSRVLQLAQAAPVALMARLPDETGGVTSASDLRPYGLTVQAFLDHLQEDAHFQHKWRGGVLLVAYPVWFADDTDQTVVPWSVIKGLRDAETVNGGFLTLDVLARTASRLNEVQLRRLAQRFPGIENVAQWRDFFALCHDISDLPHYLLSAQGSTRRIVLDAVAPNLGLNIDQLEQQGARLRTRLVAAPAWLKDPALRGFDVEVIDQSGKVLAAGGMTFPQHHFQPGVADAPPGGQG